VLVPNWYLQNKFAQHTERKKLHKNLLFLLHDGEQKEETENENEVYILRAKWVLAKAMAAEKR
jgi:hypothetical protein